MVAQEHIFHITAYKNYFDKVTKYIFVMLLANVLRSDAKEIARVINIDYSMNGCVTAYETILTKVTRYMLTNVLWSNAREPVHIIDSPAKAARW